jgi:hypothetical protein
VKSDTTQEPKFLLQHEGKSRIVKSGPNSIQSLKELCAKMTGLDVNGFSLEFFSIDFDDWVLLEEWKEIKLLWLNHSNRSTWLNQTLALCFRVLFDKNKFRLRFFSCCVSEILT